MNQWSFPRISIDSGEARLEWVWKGMLHIVTWEYRKKRDETKRMTTRDRTDNE